MFYVFSLRTSEATTPNELCLLRGGIAYGEVLTSRSLSSSNHVDVAEIFDTSLALAFDLETLRKGSRIFLCEDTYAEATRTSIGCCHKWKAVTGIGSPLSPAFEFYWPTALFQPEGQFREYFDMLCTVWYRLFTAHKSTWEVPEYDSSLYQLDETIKLCIRSAAFAPREQARGIWDLLLAHLPTERSELTSLDFRFTWGTWFQILWVLLVMSEKYSFLPTAAPLRDLIDGNLRIIEGLNYIATFRHELENPDYSWFRGKLAMLKLCSAICHCGLTFSGASSRRNSRACFERLDRSQSSTSSIAVASDDVSTSCSSADPNPRFRGSEYSEEGWAVQNIVPASHSFMGGAFVVIVGIPQMIGSRTMYPKPSNRDGWMAQCPDA